MCKKWRRYRVAGWWSRMRKKREESDASRVGLSLELRRDCWALLDATMTME